MNIQWQDETRLALRAAIEGGRIAMKSDAPLDVQVKESARDVVTSIDMEIEQSAIAILVESGYPVIGEETFSGKQFALDDRQLCWVVDAIDGTANFVNGLEYFAVSIGLCQGLNFLVGTVCLPRLQQIYCTLGADRALLNGRPLCHEHRTPSESLVAGSFSGSVGNPKQRAKQYTLFGQINDQTRGCLRLGSASTNICFTAAGRLQAAYGMNAKLWDVAGALAIAIAAGCDVQVTPSDAPFSVNYIVGSRSVVAMIRELCVAQGLMEESCQTR
ncbi:MAG: inositol monophosphatase family protein [Nitrospirota bacterium]